MKTIPAIIVQLIHIDGPMRGEIQEFSEPYITIGRNPSCQVTFPKDQTIISRNHATIEREGNRFKLSDQSTNGTFVNGKKIKETLLKNGDVMIIGEGGPKLSFLTKIQENIPSPAAPVTGTPVQSRPLATPSFEPSITPVQSGHPQMQQSAPFHSQTAPGQPSSGQQVPPAQPVQSMPVDAMPPKANIPLAIQFGPTLQSFRELPIIIGSGANCNFVMAHSGILERHSQIFFDQGQYWIKDLTGQNMISINGQPIPTQTMMHPESRIDLSPDGPVFRFMQGGRLLEIEEPKAASIEDKIPVGEEIHRSKRGKNRFFKVTLSTIVILAIIAAIVWAINTYLPENTNFKEYFERFIEKPFNGLVEKFKNILGNGK